MALVRLSALCLAIVVLAGALTAGRSYLWCAMMQQRVEACCCEPEHAGVEPVGDQGPELRNGCCAHHGHDELTKGSVVSSTIEVPPAVLVAMVPPDPAPPVALPAAPLAPKVNPCTARAQRIRAGPYTAFDTCVLLQVFRC